MKKITLSNLKDIRTGKVVKIKTPKIPCGFRSAARRAGQELKSLLQES